MNSFSIVKYENAKIGCGYKWVVTKAAMCYSAFRTDKGLKPLCALMPVEV